MDKAILAEDMSVPCSRFTSHEQHDSRRLDLDVRTTLLAAAEARRTADREEARLLSLAIQIVHLYPVDDETPVASWADPSLTSDTADPMRAHLAGAGTPQVAELAVEELGAALDVSYLSGCGLVADALELRYRLPRLWALVQDGKLQAWKARKVAQHTTHLGAEAVAFVDAQAAIAGAKNRITANLTGLVHQALVRFDPETARNREEAAKNHRDVVFDYHDGDTLGSASLYATLDAVDAHDLDATISDLAHQLGSLGDQSPLGHRRAARSGCSPTRNAPSTCSDNPPTRTTRQPSRRPSRSPARRCTCT